MFIRKIGQNVNSHVNIVWFGAFIIISEIILMIATGDSIKFDYDWITILLLLLVLFFGWTSMVGLTIAFGIESPGRIAPF